MSSRGLTRSDLRARVAVCTEGDRVRLFHHYVGSRSSGFFLDAATPFGASKLESLQWDRGPEFKARRIVALRFGDRFPELELDYRGPDVVEHYCLRRGPWAGRTPQGDLVAQEAALTALAAWAERHDVPVRRGWLDAPVVTPTRVDAPTRGEDLAARAGYRASARQAPWTWTEPSSTQERLLRWVLLRNRRTWPFAAEAAVHDDTLFVKDHVDAPHAWALPLGSVRLRWELGAGDAVYVFGRHTQVGFLRRESGCPVRAILDQRLAERSP